MERPIRFEHTRFLGDKRTQLVYDLDEWTDESIIDDIMTAETGLCFGPDTLAAFRDAGLARQLPAAPPAAPPIAVLVELVRACARFVGVDRVLD